jgi:hypothetical protein
MHLSAQQHPVPHSTALYSHTGRLTGLSVITIFQRGTVSSSAEADVSIPCEQSDKACSQGHVPDSAAMPDAMQMLTDLGLPVYMEEFEQPFLSASADFYKVGA